MELPLDRLHAYKQAFGTRLVVMEACLVHVCFHVRNNPAADHGETSLVLLCVAAMAAHADIALSRLDDFTVRALEVRFVNCPVSFAADALSALHHVVEAAAEELAAAPVNGGNLGHVWFA